MTPLLSVVTGTYNRLVLLRNMIESVRRSLGVGVPYEIILVDGGSTDGTLDWARRQGDIRLVEHGALLGAIRAFNDGCAVAKGKYVVLANDDVEFIGHTLVRAITFMEDNPHAGIGALYQDRSNFGWHVAEMPVMVDGQQKSMAYGQICIVPRWLGEKLGWWALDGARTYGGDNALSARVYEAGYRVTPIPETQVHDVSAALQDDLKRTNNAVSLGNTHPDTLTYLKRWPKGPIVTSERLFEPPPHHRQYRILYAPIYDRAFSAQHEQKWGLRDALSRIGLVSEVDYVNGQSILAVARAFKPDLLITQFQDTGHITLAEARAIRDFCRSAYWVNWNGDVWPTVLENPTYLAILQLVDLATVVNISLFEPFLKHGIQRVAYWQCAYEPEGVGYEPDHTTPSHQVIFLGNNYSPLRRANVDFLKSLDCEVGLYGSGWPEGYANGSNLYDFRAGCRLYRASRLTVSDSQWARTARGFVSNRLFQAMAAGNTLLLQEYFDGLDVLNLRNAEHLVIWHDYAELKQKIAYYLDSAHEAERAKIALQGQREVLRNHSFHARVRELLELMAEPKNRSAIDVVYR